MNKAILSAEYPVFAESLKNRGFKIIESVNIEKLIPYERRHADMQCLIIDDTAFVLSCCSEIAESLKLDHKVILCGDNIDSNYPDNVPLNAAVVGNNVIARLNSLDAKVKEYCINRGYTLINVRQGYAKCSCAVVSDNALITADKGIYNSLKETNIDVLLIQEGRVRLEGADYGFIGGASGLDVTSGKRTLYFTGDIAKHPDHERIKAFCAKHETAIISLSESALTDIGGIVFC